MTKNDKSNFERHEVVSPKKSGVKVIRITLSANARERLSSKSSGIKSSQKPDEKSSSPSEDAKEGHACAC